MRSITTLTALLLAMLLAICARASPTAARSISEPWYEVRPFVALHLGRRRYDSRDPESDADADGVGYGAVVDKLRLGLIGLRLEARLCLRVQVPDRRDG